MGGFWREDLLDLGPWPPRVFQQDKQPHLPVCLLWESRGGSVGAVPCPAGFEHHSLLAPFNCLLVMSPWVFSEFPPNVCLECSRQNSHL